MGQNRILRQFFEQPAKGFQIRGLARSLRMPKTTVGYHVNALLKKGLVVKDREGVFPSFRANESSEKYRLAKRQEFLETLMDSGLMDYIEGETRPACVVLFGSFAKGEYASGSDIELFVQAAERPLDLRKYERALGHPLHLLFETDLARMSDQLVNSIANGVKLSGFLKVR